MADDTAVHLAHCFQGEYETTCKYGDANCPAQPVDSLDLEQLRALSAEATPGRLLDDGAERPDDANPVWLKTPEGLSVGMAWGANSDPEVNRMTRLPAHANAAFLAACWNYVRQRLANP